MSKAEYLLGRLCEASMGKLNFAPGSVNLKSSGVLRKQVTVTSDLLKSQAETPSEMSTADSNENNIKILAGIGEISGQKVLYISAMKTKPFQKLVISAHNIDPIARAMAMLALQASKIAEKKGIEYVALVVESNFNAGKETRRFRACVYNAARYIGGRILDKKETDGNQLYILG
jgi:hypothetical protein